MQSSFRIFRLMGISIEVHFTFILFLLLILLAGFANFVFFLMIFLIVLAHELCHSIVAILSGIPVPRILLVPFGGLASIELPENPMTELKISISGPMFNFFFAFVGFIIITASGLNLISYGSLTDMMIEGDMGIFTPSYVLSMMVMGNLVLGLFNMLPAFPMDGGRVFRSVLALWIDYTKATQIAGRVGQVIFLFFIVAGFFTFNLWWIIIGFFLTYASGSEVKFVLLKKTFEGLLMKDIIASQRRIPVVDSRVLVKDFLSIVARPEHRFYLVSEESDSLKGVLDLYQIRRSDARDNSRSVGSIANTSYGLIEAKASVSNAMKAIISNDITLVVDGGTILGCMTPELFMELTNFYSIRKSV